MDLIRWGNGLADPFLEFESLQDEVNRLFDSIRTPESRGLFEGAYSPAVDILEYDDRFEVVCDVPGMEPKDVETSISGTVLTVKGERKNHGSMNGNNSMKMETNVGKFQRTLQLPLPIDSAKVEAVLKDGVLVIRLPKLEELRPRQISVKVS